MTEKIIKVDNTDQIINLFGNYNGNINTIQRKYNVVILSRGEDIKITGEEQNVNAAYEAIEALISVSKNGESITEQTVRYVTSMVAEGAKEELKELKSDGICVTTSGRIVRPKTVGQKKYVDAIKNNTIVMGIGPAGTGKTYLAVAMAVKYLDRKSVV